MRKSVIIFGLAILVSTLLIAIYSRHKVPVPVVPAQTETAAVNNLPPPQAVAKTDGYKLTIGVGSVQVNKNQKFSPPAGSVVITNGEKQLQQLVELSRHQKTNTQ